MPKDSYLEGLKSERAKRADMLNALKRAPEANEDSIRDLEREIAILDANLGQAIEFARGRPVQGSWRLRLGRYRRPAS